MPAPLNSADEPKASPEREPGKSAEVRLETFEKRQSELWRLTFLLLLILTIVFAWLSWGTLQAEKSRFEAFAYTIGLVILVVLFGAYIWKKTQEIAELKGLVRGLDQRDANLPSDRQMQQLFEIISKSQQGFRDLIDSFDDILLALSLDGEIRAVNRSFSDLVGRPFQEIIGCHLSEFLEDINETPPDSIALTMSRFLERRHWTGTVHVRVKRTNASHFFDCVAHAMLREDKVHGLTILARDITSVRRSEARFTELFESLQEGIYIVTPEDQILEVNPALVRMLGYESKEALLGKHVSEILVDQEQRDTLAREIQNQPSPQGHEITLRRKDGQPLLCLNTSTVVRDSSGRVIRYQGALVDITERRAIEKRLHKEQEFARRLIDSFPDLIFVVDANRRYTFASPRVEEVLGYKDTEMVGIAFGEHTHRDERAALHGVMDDMLAGRRNFASVEVRVRHKEGEWRSLRCHFSPLFDEQGKIEGVVISGRDVTELKRLEEQLIQAEKLAAMGQMLAGVAHELNNPLTAILGVSELLRDRQGVDDSTKRQLEMTHRQARRAARIVQNLLEFSRPASPQKKVLDLNNIIDRTLQLHEHSLRRNNIEVDFRPFPSLPPITGDANQLIQVFLNLVSNAEQAIREVRKSGRIQIRLAQSANRITATVQDDGVGIKPEAVARLFDPFFTTKRPGGGTGLGLSICMSILREHGGNIEAESLPAGGAAFTVSFPPASHGPGAGTPRDPDSSTATGEIKMKSLSFLQGRSVLVLDDEESIRMLLLEGLAAHGVKVECAASAEEALSLVLSHSFDAILCDLKLAGTGPDADGFGVGQRLRVAAGSHRPEIVYMSGDVVEKEVGRTGWRPDHALQKPFRISDVLAVLLSVINEPPTEPKKT